GVGEEARRAKTAAPRRITVGAGHEQRAARAQHAPDLAQYPHARIEVLDDVEEERGVDGGVRERKAPGDVPGEEVGVGDGARRRRATRHGEMPGIVVEAVD